MEQPEDTNEAATTGPRQDGDRDPDQAAGYRVDVGGSASGPVIAGHHNVVVDAQHGSAVTLLMAGQRPRPVRRDRVELLPGRRHTPLGRNAELAALADAVGSGGPVLLWGPPGVGKSTLLRHAARTLSPGPDGVLFLSAAHREPRDLAQDIFEACYDTDGYAPSNTELRRLMAGVEVTVYLDDADLTAAQLQELVDAAPDATFVLTSRERVLLGAGTALRIKGLDRAAGLELLARELGRPAPEEAQATAELWQATEGVPLLLLRAAALARRDASGSVLLPRPGASAELLPLLLDQLDRDTANVLRLLATLADAELAPAHISALADVPEPSAVCGRLVNLGLITATGGGYRCAADVVPAVRERHPEPFPAERLCVYFARWAAQPSTPPAHVADHAGALERAAELAEQAGRCDLTVDLARAAAPALARALRTDAWGRMLDIGLEAAQRTGDTRAVAYFTHESGVRSLVTGRRVVAGVLLAEAVVLWRQLGDHAGADAAAGAGQYAPAPPSAPSAPDGGAATSPNGDAAPHGDAGSVGDAGSYGDTGSYGDGTAGQAGSGGGSGSGSGSGTGPGSGSGPDGSPADSGTAPDATGAPDATPDSGLTADPGLTDHPAAHTGEFAQGPAGSGPAPDPSSATTAQVPPGAGETGSTAGGTAGSTTGSATGGTAGSTHAGASAATGAATTGGASVGTVVLTTLAVVAAVAIGGVAYNNHQESEARKDLATLPTPTPARDTPTPGLDLPTRDAPDPTPSEETTEPPEPTFTREPDPEPTPTPTGLAGTWRDSQGDVFSISEKAPGVYTMRIGACGGGFTTAEFRGGNGTYRGNPSVSAHVNGSCARMDLSATITLAGGEDSDTGQYTKQLRAGSSQNVQCTTCGTRTITRLR
ncbi:AAA family ATPase [Streptomyces sp. PU-14G]|uniref:AAA family ATPase n=1 Tax=Streptomyces sp. PU-14G TaxID=2800808 RepID=UPI0034DE9992